ncbi:MAG TPA: hypothetical protein VNH65_18920 [Candidatus Acidoferrum sp.]|nr:hypothetical protein [Candidatus Acidoferrum sp.]
MEQQTQSVASPKPAPAAHGLNRCRARNRTGAQCRLPAQDPAKGFCARHADRVSRTTHSAADRADLSAELFGEVAPTFQSAEEINATLAHVVVLVAQGRISSRRAAVITYALSLILRGVLVIDKKAADAPSKFDWSDPWRPACVVRAEAARNSSAASTPSPNDGANSTGTNHQPAVTSCPALSLPGSSKYNPCLPIEEGVRHGYR